MFVSHDRNLTAEMAGALAKFSTEVSNPEKNARNPHFKSSYADLGEVLRVVRPALGKHGLSLIQGIETHPGQMNQESGEVVEGGAYLRTMLLHESGGFIESVVRVPYSDPGRGSVAQAMGSAVTYMRRYQALALCGIAADDDDGNSAGNTPPQSQRQHQQPSRAPQPQGNAAPPPPPVVDVPDDLRKRIESLDNLQKLEGARKWLREDGQGLSETAKNKALAMIDARENVLKEGAA